MDEHATAAVPRCAMKLLECGKLIQSPFNICRPGTSINSANTASRQGSYDPSVRPMSQSGRPITGFARPSSSRPTTGSNMDLRTALQSSRRSGTARPMTNLGREVRLGTASLSSNANGPLVDVEKLNIKKYARKTGLAMVLAEYLLYVEHNTRKALDLCSEATKEADYKNWWWKVRLGKCYFKLGTKNNFSLLKLIDGDVIFKRFAARCGAPVQVGS